MTDDTPFVDYYAILQIERGCSSKALEAAYRHWAKLYHPDHPETEDVTKFNQVIEAYRVLRSPAKRARYDALHAVHRPGEAAPSPLNGAGEGEEKVALDDAEAHARILLMLYKRRRENALDAGVSDYLIQEMLGCSLEHLEFHRWYLKAKGYIEITEQGTLAITIEGIDHVIAKSQTTKVEKLLIAQAREQENSP
jgi:curved DNA-binding protein